MCVTCLRDMCVCHVTYLIYPINFTILFSVKLFYLVLILGDVATSETSDRVN